MIMQKCLDHAFRMRTERMGVLCFTSAAEH